MPTADYYAKNKQRCIDANRKFRVENPEWVKKHKEEYKRNNPDRFLTYAERAKRYRKAQKDRMANGTPMLKDIRAWVVDKVRRIRNGNSKTRGAVCTMTNDHVLEVWLRQKGRCALSGVKLKCWAGKHDPMSASIDRIDPRKGYVDGNIRFLAWCVNSFRCHMTDKEVVRIARAIVSRA